MDVDSLVEKVQKLLSVHDRIVVAVSGFGGSGKTTLAEKLKLKFPKSNLIQLDNFLVNRGQGEGWAGGYDWPRFEQVLQGVKAGEDLHYKYYDWEKDALSDVFIDEELQKLVIVEGAKILQSRLMEYFDFSVWVDVDIKEATERGKNRDRKNWVDKTDQKGVYDHLKTWHEVWEPKDKEYFAKSRPDKLADFIYKNPGRVK